MGRIQEALHGLLQWLANLLSGLMLRAGFAPPNETLLIRAVGGTLLVLAVSVALSGYALLASQRDKRDAVLIVGCSGVGDAPSVGKTTLFKVLRRGGPPALTPVPSMEPNEATFAPRVAARAAAAAARAPAPVRWVDFPGHARLRPRLDGFLAHARCVVFVIDAARFAQDARRDAALLYDVLTHPVVERYSTPVLIFCNKTDAPAAVSPAAVCARLQAELERARNAQKNGLGEVSADGEDAEPRQLGFENMPFVFDHAHGPVSFSGGSALKNDVMGVVNFVRSSFL